MGTSRRFVSMNFRSAFLLTRSVVCSVMIVWRWPESQVDARFHVSKLNNSRIMSIRGLRILKCTCRTSSKYITICCQHQSVFTGTRPQALSLRPRYTHFITLSCYNNLHYASSVGVAAAFVRFTDLCQWSRSSMVSLKAYNS